MTQLRAIWQRPAMQTAIRLVWTAAVVVFIAIALAVNWQELQSYTWQVDGRFLILAALAALLRRLAGGLHWSMSVTLVNRQSFRHSLFFHLRVYFISNMATYLPGTYWFVPSRVYMNAKEGVSALQTAVSLAIEQVSIIVSGAMIAALYLPAVLPALGLSGDFLVPAIGVTLILGLVLVHPRVLSTSLHILSRLLQRPPLQTQIKYVAMLNLLGLGLAVWLMSGASLYFLARALDPTWQADVLMVSSIFAISWLIGFFTPFAPSGLGVREGVMLILLTSIGVETTAAVVISLLSRLLIILEDVGWYLIVIRLTRLEHGRRADR